MPSEIESLGSRVLMSNTPSALAPIYAREAAMRADLKGLKAAGRADRNGLLLALTSEPLLSVLS